VSDKKSRRQATINSWQEREAAFDTGDLVNARGRFFCAARTGRIDDQNWPEYARDSVEVLWREPHKKQQLTLPQFHAQIDPLRTTFAREKADHGPDPGNSWIYINNIRGSGGSTGPAWRDR
jgi:hypothetical protein